MERFTRCRAIYVLCVNRICDNYAFSKYRRCRYDVEEKIKIDSGQQKGVDGGDNNQSFWDLCSYIETLDSVTVPELRKLYFIQNQLIRHMVYRFDDNDMSEISNLPSDYWNYAEQLETAINAIENITI